ncbi:MAG: ThiF family adenylyltransferase, partial [bacterium]|nr:ThiF family adenylyltransferase [bacterium]
MNEFDRLKLLIGENNFDKIFNLNILVIGLGGVGGYVVESLARSGVNNLTLVDFDKIDITNINRQIIATYDSIGNLKTEEFKKRISLINRNCNVKMVSSFIGENNIDLLFTEKYDYIVDCCDSVKTKELIIKYCKEKNIKSITCCGTGNKLDPTKLEITDLSKTNYDPLAKILRKYVKENNIKGKIICCSSVE